MNEEILHRGKHVVVLEMGNLRTTTTRPLHILLEKKAIVLKRIASKKGHSARDYALKVLLCSHYTSVKIDIPGFKILKHDN